MYIIYCDGASRSNPGEASYGVSINLNNKEIDTLKEYIGIATNNVAEYRGLIAALEYCVKNNINDVEIYLDSLLVVQQVNKEFKVKSKKLGDLYSYSLTLIGKRVWRVRASFLPGQGVMVAEKLKTIAMHEIDLTQGAVLEKGCGNSVRFVTPS